MGRGLKGPKPGKPGKMGMPVPVIVPLNGQSMAAAAATLLVGVPAFVLFWKFNNDHINFLHRACPVIKGRLYDWGYSMACILLFVSGVCLCRSGIVSRVLLGLGLRNEAICVGICCMGKAILGTVIDISLSFLVVVYTALGSKLLKSGFF